jgi:hypothetical protein
MTKKIKNKINEIIYKSYKDAINNRMAAGFDVSLMTNRLNYLMSEYKKI